jgi:hypothetical protein
MKHQLFKQGTYVEIDIKSPYLQVIGKVKDSTIIIKRIMAEQIFNIPQEAIELEMEIITIYEHPDITPKFMDNPYLIKDLIEFTDMNGIMVEGYKLYAAVADLRQPSTEVKKLYYSLKQGAKQI